MSGVNPVDFSAAKKKKSKSLRPWAIIDATGQTTVLELDKYEIMRRVHISVRDLRILDHDNSYPCTILGRERAIVLHLEPIKMIITAEEVYLRDPEEIVDVLPLLDELRKRLSVENKAGCVQGDGEEILDAQTDADDEDESPFEFRALEVALETIYSLLQKRAVELEISVYPALDELTTKISNRNLDRIRQLKRRTTPLIARVKKVRDELERLMENDDDLAELCLSGKLARTTSILSGEPISNPTPRISRKFSRAKRASSGSDRGEGYDVEELEILLEPYFFRINNVMSILSMLQEYIDDTEDYINIKLDNVRNQLIKFDVILSSASICVSVYSLVAGILGMNIPNSWNNQRYMFKWVVSVTGTLCGILFVVIMLYARYQRLVGF